MSACAYVCHRIISSTSPFRSCVCVCAQPSGGECSTSKERNRISCVSQSPHSQHTRTHTHSHIPTTKTHDAHQRASRHAFLRCRLRSNPPVSGRVPALRRVVLLLICCLRGAQARTASERDGGQSSSRGGGFHPKQWQTGEHIFHHRRTYTSHSLLHLCAGV